MDNIDRYCCHYFYESKQNQSNIDNIMNKNNSINNFKNIKSNDYANDHIENIGIN